MEHYSTTAYLMWMKSKSPSSMNSSAASFQEPFGGFIWPPRSYTCSFCRREFRSAQALGGHMNVHRRDRAKLKQSSPPQQADEAKILHHQKHTSASYQENSLDRRILQAPPTIFTPLNKEVREPFINSEEILTEENTRRSGKPGLWDDQCNDDEDFIETKLSMGTVFCKRHKKSSGVSPLPFFHSKLCSSDRCNTSSSMEDIDLELRLGDPPAVK